MEQSIIFAFLGHNYTPPNWNQFFLKQSTINRIYYIHSGTGGYIRNGEKKLFEKGKLYFIPNTSNVQVFADENDPLLHSYCNFELFPPIFSNDVIALLPNDMDKIIIDLFVYYCKKNKGTSAFSDIELKPNETKLYYAMIDYLVSRFKEYLDDTVFDDEVILKTLKYMYDNIADEITVTELANLVFMSESGYIRRFKRYMGCTPYTYLKTIRLNKALYLQSLGYTLEYVAEQTGYADASTLSHAKKRSQKI